MINKLFGNKKTMSCQEFYEKLLADGWKRTGQVGSLVSLRYNDLKIVVDLTKDTGYVDPNGDVATGWTPNPAGTHYTCIDDGTRQPSTPNTSDLLNGTSNNAIDTFNMTTLSSASSVTNVTIWGYGTVSDSGVGNAVHGYTNLTGATTPTNFSFTNTASWKSISFSGTWTQANLDGLQVSIKNIFPVPLTSAHIYALYCVITYTSSTTTANNALFFGTNF